jgi:hypothetical protein
VTFAASLPGPLPQPLDGLQYSPGTPVGPGGGGGAPAPSGSAGWEVFVRSYADYSTLLCKIPLSMLTSWSFVKQLDDVGSGSVTLIQDDPWWDNVVLGDGSTSFTILDFECLWQFYQDGVCRFEFLGETITEQLVDQSEQRIVQVAGPGTMAVLKWAMAAPNGFPDIVLKADALVDSFDEVDINGNAVIDTNIWNVITPSNSVFITPITNLYTYPGGATYQLSTLYPSGTMSINATSSTTFLGSLPYDCTDTLLSAQITPIGAASIPTDANGNPEAYGTGLNGSELTQMYMQSLANSSYYALIGLSGTAFYCQLGGPSGVFTKTLPAYDSTNDAYWMITEQAGAGGGSGTFFFWTSPDGQTWTELWSIVHNWDATNCAVYFAAKYSVTGQSAILTNLNSNVTTPSYQGQIYLGEPIMGIWKDLLNQAQSRGTIPYVTTTITPTGDSFGRPWPDVQNVQVTNGTDLFTLLQGACATLDADYVMQPGFVLEVGQPEANAVAIGIDRSEQIVFREARDQDAKTRTRARDSIQNVIGAENNDGREISATDAGSVGTWGQREGWFQVSAQIDPVSMEIAAAAAAAEQADEVTSYTLDIPPSFPGETVFHDFDVGDWVGLERPDFSATDAVRVMAIAVASDQDGNETNELTLQTYIAFVEQQLTYLANKLGGAFINAQGTTAVAPSKYGTGQVPSYFTPSSSLGSLSNVISNSGTNNAPLVFNSSTGQWQAGGTTDPVSGTVLGMTVSTSTGTVAVSGGTVAVTGTGTSVAPDGGGTSPPGSSVVTTDTGTTYSDASGTPRIVTGVQTDGTITTVEHNGVTPGAPDTPIAAPDVNGIDVAWDGLLGGVAPLSDFLYVEVHVSSTSGFTPSSGTLQGTLTAAGICVVSNLTNGTTYYAKLVARNRSRMASAASAQASAPALSVVASIPNGSISAAQLNFTAGGVNVTISPTQPSSPSAGDLWYDSSNGYQLNQYNGTSWTAYQFGTNAIAAGSITAALIAANTITAAQIASGTITAAQITSATITATQIAANTITASKLSAGIVVAGIVDSTVVTGSTIQNSGSNPRTSINPDGSISITNTSGTVIFEVGPDGSMFWYSSGGVLLMQLQPGGNTLIYASTTGPQSFDNEPPAGVPAMVAQANSVTSASSYTVAVTVAVVDGSTVTLAATCTGATAATSVTDTQGNSYTLVQSETSGEQLQVFKSDNVNALTTSDHFTVNYGSSNTQAKTWMAFASSGLTSSSTDFSNKASGTSTAPSVSGTPVTVGDLVYLVVANATGGGAPTAVNDGWYLVASFSSGTSNVLSVYVSCTASTSAITGTATITSAAWGAVILGQKPAVPPGGFTVSNCTVVTTTAWSGDGLFSYKVAHSNTTSPYTITTPKFAVQGFTGVTMQCQINANTAMTGVSCGLNFYTSGGTFISSAAGDQAATAMTSGQTNVFSITGALAPVNAAFASFFVQEADTTSTTSFNLDVISAAGGLIYSNSPTGGTDQFGNTFDQGINFIGLPGLTNILGVEDPYGNQLSRIDGSGNVAGQTLLANTDVIVAGDSLLGTLLPNLPQGIIARGWVTPSSYPWPTSALSTTETAILEVDATLEAGRMYRVAAMVAAIATGVSSWGRSIIRYTSDGSTPTTSSTVLIRTDVTTNGTNTASLPAMENFIAPSSTALYRFLLTSQTGGGGAALQFQSGNAAPSMVVEDVGLGNGQNTTNLGITIGTGTSGSSGSQTITQSWYPTQTYSYYGSGASNGSNAQRGTGFMWQGNPGGATGSQVGDQYSFILWPYAAIQSALSGATINSTTFRLTNYASHYSTGTFAVLGYANYGTFAHTGNLSGAHENVLNYEIGEGATNTRNLTGTGLGSALQSGSATCFILGPSSSTSGGSGDLYNYGIWYGAGSSSSVQPMITINYTTV